MEWKGLLAILMATALAALGTVTGKCSNELFMVCSAIVAGVFGLARSGGDTRKVHTEINHPAPPTFP